MQQDLSSLKIGATLKGDAVISAEQVQKFADAVGDMNPVHFSREAAIAAGFVEGPVVHGDLLPPLANQFLVERFPGVILKERRSNWVRPVVVGAKIEMSGIVIGLERFEGFGHWFLKIICDISFKSRNKICANTNVIALLKMSRSQLDQIVPRVAA